MGKISFTQEQIKEILAEIAKQKDGFETLLKLSLEALMKSEREEFKNQYNDSSNGFRKRMILGAGSTQLILDVPRTRKHNFYPVILAILNDREAEARELAFKLYSAGLTTEQVAEIYEHLYGKYYSKSQISRMFQTARETVWQWLERPLEEYYPIVYVDAIFLPVRRVDSVSREAFYTVLGVRADRRREVLALVNFPTESATGWKELFSRIKQRGVKRIDLVVSDALKGIEDAIASEFSSANIQFCTTHLKRNVLNRVKSKDKDMIALELKEVFKTDDPQDSPQKGWQRWKEFIQKHSAKYKVLERMLEPRYYYYFTYLKYDYRIRSMIYTTNWIERLNRDYRRATRMRGAMPTVDSAITLLGAVAMDKTAFERKIPRLNYDKSFDWICDY